MRLLTLTVPLLLQAASLVTSTAVPESVDVVVVGAGLAGLTAARDLLHGNKSVIVLEARDRVGGKVYNKPLTNGAVTEVGAEFVGPTQDKVLGMISDLGLQIFDTYDKGQTIMYRNNTRVPFTPDPAVGGAPPVDTSSLLQIGAAREQLDAWAAELNVTSPWSHPQAAKWDAQTFEDYITEYANDADARFVLTTAVKALLSVEMKEVSLLYVLAYIAAAGNETTTGTLERLVAAKGGAQESRVVGGTGLIPTRLAENIVGMEHIVLNAPVTHITKCSQGYKVVSRSGTVLAKKVVVAMAPPLLKQIKFSPALPLNRTRLNEDTIMPPLGKGIAIYKTPFWRADNLSAAVQSDSGSTRVVWDSSPDDGSFGALLGFLLGDEMRALDRLSPTDAQAKIMPDYVRYFGPQASNVTEFVLQRWDLEEWSRGGPVAIAPPNVLGRYGPALRENADGLHFAGTETSEYWTGYMDGAIRSGERVAMEILSS
jgi:monoamine oxidase